MKTLLVLFLSISLAGFAEAATKNTTLKVESPKADSEVSGMIEILVRCTEDYKQVIASVPGSTHVKLQRVSTGAKQWTGKLDTTLIPNGRAQIMVSANVRTAKALIELKVNNPLRTYFGDLHSHSMFSDGVLLPESALEHARDVVKLDFFILTDHLERGTDVSWMDSNEMSYRAHENGRFVVIPGLEWTKAVGHINIINPQKRMWPATLEKFFEEAAAYDVILQINHAVSKKYGFKKPGYNEIGGKVVRLFEVRSDEEGEAFRRALACGWHVAPTGTDDNHSDQWGSRAWTGALMPGLSKGNLLDALRRRHVYSTTDRNCRLWFGLNNAVMGDEIAEPQEAVKIQVRVEDPDPQDTIARIEILQDGAVIKTLLPKATKVDETVAVNPTPGKHYYFVRVVQTDGQKLWSAPIWLSKK